MTAVVNQALKEQIQQTAVRAAEKAAQKDTNAIEPASVNTMRAQEDIRQGAAEAIRNNPLLAHLTSSENPLQSRAVWAAVIGAVGNLVVPWGARFGFDIDPADVDSTANLIIDTVQVGMTLWAGYLALRARYAKKPLTFFGLMGP